METIDLASMKRLIAHAEEQGCAPDSPFVVIDKTRTVHGIDGLVIGVGMRDDGAVLLSIAIVIDPDESMRAQLLPDGAMN
jgi:hypothetical protein